MCRGGDSPEQHAAAIGSEIVRWAELVKKAGLDKTILNAEVARRVVARGDAANDGGRSSDLIARTARTSL